MLLFLFGEQKKESKKEKRTGEDQEGSKGRISE